MAVIELLSGPKMIRCSTNQSGSARQEHGDRATISVMPDDPVRDYLRRIGKKGGKKGGPARMRQLTSEQRAALGRKGGKASGAARKAKKG
jgi:hypothetical protein